ncbi:hypothetical protein chiPu_0025134, partial [Chiloscyllium punctatum]|nr:hypothetical protein [Chiloscyllium punctatum]
MSAWLREEVFVEGCDFDSRTHVDRWLLALRFRQTYYAAGQPSGGRQNVGLPGAKLPEGHRCVFRTLSPSACLPQLVRLRAAAFRS